MAELLYVAVRYAIPGALLINFFIDKSTVFWHLQFPWALLPLVVYLGLLRMFKALSVHRRRFLGDIRQHL